MFGNPTSAGMNQGAAQVFDTSGMVNAYIRTSMIERENRALEDQAVAKMLGQFDSSKLRAKDIPKFNETFGKLQNLYISNKGLYRNPMKNPQAYAQASSLVNDLRTLVADSKMYEDFGSKVSQVAIQNRNSLDPNFLGKLQTWNNLGVDEIKAMNGGRMPDYTDVQYVPEEPKPEEMRKFISGTAQSLGAVKTNRTFLTSKQDPNIPEFDEVRIDETVVDVSKMDKIANVVLANPRMEQYYQYKYDNLEQGEKNAIRMDLVQKYPESTNSMSGAQMLATSEFISQYRVLDRKETVGSNTDALRADQERQRKESQQFQARESAKSRAFTAQMRAQYSGGQSQEEEVQNLNLVQTQEFLSKVNFLGGGTNSKTTNPLIKQAIKPFAYLSGALEKDVKVIHPGDYRSAQAFADAVDANLDGATPKQRKETAAEVFTIDKTTAMDMWKQKTPAVVFETKETKDEPGKVYMINPKRENMDFALQPIINAFGSKRTGFAQNAPGYTQPKKR